MFVHNPLLYIFIIALSTTIIAVWLISYVLNCIARIFLAKPIAKFKRFKAQIMKGDILWPRVTSGRTSSLDCFLGWAGLRRFFIEPAWTGFISIILAVLFVFLFGLRSIPIMLLILGVGVGLVVFKVRRRKRAFISLLPQALDILVQSLRAGYSLQQAFSLVTREAVFPVREVFQAIDRGVAYMKPLREILKGLENEIKLAEWNLFTDSLLVQEYTGGNIIPIIERVSDTLRQNVAIEQEVHAATASGRMSGLFIAFLVPVVFILFFTLNPVYMQVFFTTGLGRILLILAIVLEFVGFMIIRKITSITY